MLSHALKLTAAAAVLGLGAIAVSGTPASADTFKTRCYGDDCVRMQCDDWGRDCFRIGEFGRYDYDRVAPYNYDDTYNAYPGAYYARPDYDYDYGYTPFYDDDYPG